MSGGLMSCGLKSGGLMSGGLKSYDPIFRAYDLTMLDQWFGRENGAHAAYAEQLVNTPTAFLVPAFFSHVLNLSLRLF